MPWQAEGEFGTRGSGRWGGEGVGRRRKAGRGREGWRKTRGDDGEKRGESDVLPPASPKVEG